MWLPMWLPKGGQLKTVTYAYPPRHKEIAKEKKKKEQKKDVLCFSLIVSESESESESENFFVSDFAETSLSCSSR